MSVDVLQEKIRKAKNPFMVDLALRVSDIPNHLLQEEPTVACAYGRFCKEMLVALKGTVPAVRIGFTSFAVLGPEGLEQLRVVLKTARTNGYYVALEAPYVLSPMMAASVAESVWGEAAWYPCDGLISGIYPGSDLIKPFLSYVRDCNKDFFAVVRTSNKSAPEVQDLLTGSRLVHAAAADMVNRYAVDNIGKFGYGRVAIMVGANSAPSLSSLRAKYPNQFFLIDDTDYSGCNLKNCAAAFDKFGHGAVVCAGPTITAAWQQAESDGSDYLEHSLSAAVRMKKNLARYITVF